MRIHELVPVAADLVIHNEDTGHTMVLTPQAAVYDTEDTTDLRNISIAFGLLFTSDAWRAADKEEIDELRLRPPVRMMELHWAIPKPKPRPALAIVANNVLEQRAREIYRMLDGASDHPWVEGGNSFMQDEARRLARLNLDKE